MYVWISYHTNHFTKQINKLPRPHQLLILSRFHHNNLKQIIQLLRCFPNIIIYIRKKLNNSSEHLRQMWQKLNSANFIYIIHRLHSIIPYNRILIPKTNQNRVYKKIRYIQLSLTRNPDCHRLKRKKGSQSINFRPFLKVLPSKIIIKPPNLMMIISFDISLHKFYNIIRCFSTFEIRFITKVLYKTCR